MSCNKTWTPYGLQLLAAAVASLPLTASAQLKINEVYYNVSPQGGNQFVELYNSAPTNCYLDGMILTDEAGTGNEGVFKFPGTPGGTTLPVTPGQFIVIAVDATGATINADWECYAGGTDTDNPSVPNLTLIHGNEDLSLLPSGDGVLLADGTCTNLPICLSSIVDGMNYGGGDGELVPLSSTVPVDPNPFETAPPGSSLCRCGNGNDSDASSLADFLAENITRGAPNNCSGPDISVSDSYALEGDTGTTFMAFTVFLARSSIFTITVNYATSNGTAQAGSDYIAVTNTLLTFAPSVTSQTVQVSVIGNTIPQPNRTFFVVLMTPTNAALSHTPGTGLIIDDEVSGFYHIAGGGLIVTSTWKSVSGLVYQAQFATNLVNPAWLNVGGPVTAAAQSVSVADPASSVTQRFYRVLQLQF